jgi:hypothetical protein
MLLHVRKLWINRQEAVLGGTPSLTGSDFKLDSRSVLGGRAQLGARNLSQKFTQRLILAIMV